MKWHIREYEQSDESCVVALWLMSHASSEYGKRIGLVTPELDELGRRKWVQHAGKFQRYWRAHSPLVMKLIRRAPPMVLCDPQARDVIWAFACLEAGDGSPVVHMFVRKRKFAEFGEEMLRDLIYKRPGIGGAVASHEMPDTTGAFPYDEFWLARNL